MADKRIERSLAAILAVDVVGYSRLMGVDEEGTLEAITVWRAELIDPKVAEYRGRIVKNTGDGALAEFASVVDAVRCAIEIQRGAVERNRGIQPDKRVELRIGINVGDIIIQSGDIFGDGVNIAARLEQVAQPGGIAVSSRVYEDVRDRIAERFVDHGEKNLKNIARPIRVYQWAPAAGASPAKWSLVRSEVTNARAMWAAAIMAAVIAIGGAVWWQVFQAKPSDITQRNVSTPSESLTGLRASARVGIAVLPFANQSGEAAQDYFSEGITDDLIGALGRFSGLAVAAGNATMPYKERATKPSDIGRELGVSYVVEGSVRRMDSRVRVKAQLSDAASDKLLWSHSYDEELRDVFSLQETVTRQVAGALAVSLGRIEQQRASSKPTEKLDAYDLLLRGRERFRLATRASNRQARAFFDQAIRADPAYADAYAALARAFAEIATHGWAEDLNEAADQVREYCQKALALDPDNYTAMSVMAWLYTVRGQYELALATSEQAIALNPSHVESILARAGVLLWFGRIGDAVIASDLALRLDPNPLAGTTFNVAMAYYQGKRHTDAAQLLERAILRFPTTSYLYLLLAANYGQLGRPAEAERAFSEFRRLDPFYDLETSGARFQNRDNQAYFVEGLTKAGLK